MCQVLGSLPQLPFVLYGLASGFHNPYYHYHLCHLPDADHPLFGYSLLDSSRDQTYYICLSEYDGSVSWR